MKHRIVADHLQCQWPLYWSPWPLTPFLIELSTPSQNPFPWQSEVLTLLYGQRLTFVTYFTKYLPVSCDTSWFHPGDISLTRGSGNGGNICSQETELEHSSPLDPSCQGRRALCHRTWGVIGYTQGLHGSKINLPYLQKLHKGFKKMCLEKLYNNIFLVVQCPFKNIWLLGISCNR